MKEWVKQFRRLPATVQDTALAVAAVWADLELFGVHPPLSVIAYAAIGGMALVWRRRAPLLVFAILWLHSLLSLWTPSYYPLVGQLLALYTVAAYRSLKTAGVALVLTALADIVEAVHEAATHQGGLHLTVIFLLFYALTAGPVWATGRWVQVSWLHAAELEHRREMEAREAVATERTRIARELHDIVSHSVTIMILQAAIATRLISSDPARARQALTDVDDQGRQAMGEMSRMLVALRAANSGDHADEPGLGSGNQEGLAHLETLLAGVTRAGVSVEFVAPGPAPRLDRSVDLTAYRIVQEALTNTTKHAGPGAHAVVRWTWSAEGSLVVQVRDDGDGQRQHAGHGLSAGHGLLGLRERVAVIGGHLEAGPTPEGGFEVTATLPIGGRAAATPRREVDTAPPVGG
jgi:signal transduction histidine kinase